MHMGPLHLGNGDFLLDPYKVQHRVFIRERSDRIVAVVLGDRTSRYMRSLSADRYLAETCVFVVDVILCRFLLSAACDISVVLLSRLLACTVLLPGGTTKARFFVLVFGSFCKTHWFNFVSLRGDSQHAR